MILKRIAISAIVILAIISSVGTVFFYRTSTKFFAEASDLSEKIKLEDTHNKDNLLSLETGLKKKDTELRDVKKSFDLEKRGNEKKNETLQADNDRLAEDIKKLSKENVDLTLQMLSNKVENDENAKIAAPIKASRILSSEIQNRIATTSHEIIDGLIKRHFKTGVSRRYYDKVYFYPTMSDVTKIIEIDITDELEGEDERRDCDNFEQIFLTEIGKNYGLNFVGTVEGILNNNEDDGHAWNILLIDTGNGPDLYFLEPQTDEIVKVGAETILNGKIYTPTKIIWK